MESGRAPQGGFCLVVTESVAGPGGMEWMESPFLDSLGRRLCPLRTSGHHLLPVFKNQFPTLFLRMKTSAMLLAVA